MNGPLWPLPLTSTLVPSPAPPPRMKELGCNICPALLRPLLHAPLTRGNLYLGAKKYLWGRGCICHTAYSASTPPGRVKTCARQLINDMRVDNQNKQSFPFDLLKG